MIHYWTTNEGVDRNKRNSQFNTKIVKVNGVILILVLWLATFGCTISQEPEVDIIETDVDYPILSEIPNTGFVCDGRSPGYYADDHPTSSCQVFHYCHHDGRTFDFLCPNSTIFNQKVFACDHFYNFECHTAKEFYMLNDLFYNGTLNTDDYIDYSDDEEIN